MKERKIGLLIIYILLVGLLQIEAQEGTLAVIGDVIMTNSTIYESHIKNLNGEGEGHDQITSSGNLTLDGTLDIILDGYSPSVADHFEIMTYGGVLNGSFSTINWPAAMTAQGWLIDYGVIFPGTVTIYGPSGALPVNLVKSSVIDYYPNPAKDVILFSEAVDHVEIYNMSGQLIVDEKKIGKELNISSLPKGNYLITINQDRVSTQTLIKH